MVLDRQPRLEGQLVSLRLLREGDFDRSRRAVKKLGAVVVGTEPDVRGRGDSVVYRLHALGAPRD